MLLIPIFSYTNTPDRVFEVDREDFQDFSQADQEFFDKLLMPLEELNFSNSDELIVEPKYTNRNTRENNFEIKSQNGIVVQEIPLLSEQKAREAFEYLRSIGITPADYKQAYEHEPLPTTKAIQRQAARTSLDDKVKNEVGKILGERKINPGGYDLDKKHLRKTNFIVLKSSIDKKICQFLDRSTGERSEYSKVEIDNINMNFNKIIQDVIREVF